MTITRRQFGRMAAAAAPIVTTTCSSPSLVAQPKLDSRIHGVQIGVISGSFQDIPVSELIHSIVEVGLGDVELLFTHAEALAGAVNALKTA